MNEQWIKQMQQKMADYTQPAPEVSWAAIDQAMTATRPRKLMLHQYWFRGVAAAVVLLIITGISIRIMHRQEGVQLQQTTPVNKEQITTPKEEQMQPQLTDSPTEKLQPTYMAYMAETKVKETFAESDSDVTVCFTEESAESDNVTEEQTKPFIDYPDIPAPTKDKHQSGRLLAQAYMSNAMSGSRHNEFNTQTVYNNIILIPDGPISTSTNNPVSYDTIKDVNTIQTNESIHHHQPLKVGLSLRYQFSDRWSLESGLTYTLLTSDLTTVENGITSYSKQELHYIGLPLNVGYQLLKDRNLGLYVTAGGTIDKNLNGSDWLFSLNGSAGAEYKLSNRLSIYAEPGIGYYFPNRSNLSTIYQDQPFNFNINIGLRFDLKR